MQFPIGADPHCLRAADGSSASASPTFMAAPIKLDIGEEHIGGLMYMPAGAPPYPLVICSHGFTGTHQNLVGTCEMLAQLGVAALTFDFRNGTGELSSGRFLDMSVTTEVADLVFLLSAARQFPMVDSSKIVLLGHSQGGLVSALVAAHFPDQVAGLILAYPALCIPDDVHSLFADREALPDTYSIHGATVGRVFAEAVWDLDVFALIGQYDKPVLIMHGTDDIMVPISYSERAAGTYAQAELIRMEGAGHGFKGADLQKSYEAIRQYLERIGIISKPE